MANYDYADCPTCGSDDLDVLEEWEEPVSAELVLHDGETVTKTRVRYSCNDCLTIFTDDE